MTPTAPGQTSNNWIGLLFIVQCTNHSNVASLVYSSTSGPIVTYISTQLGSTFVCFLKPFLYSQFLVNDNIGLKGKVSERITVVKKNRNCISRLFKT